MGLEAKPCRKKSYAVGLEMSCPGGAYHWAPEIPQRNEDIKRHAKKM